MMGDMAACKVVLKMGPYAFHRIYYLLKTYRFYYGILSRSLAVARRLADCMGFVI